MAVKKDSSLALLEILTERTDENHILTGRELIALLHENYNLDIERRTLYSNLSLLKRFGYHISDYEDNGKGYYLTSRQFDKAEVLLLCNAIHASHFISQRQSNQLIKKLLTTLSMYEQAEFTPDTYMPNPRKTANTELMNTITAVSEAIRDHKQLKFTYLRYDKEKKMVPRREEPYIVEPRYIVYKDSRPYMVVTSPHHEGFSHYRLDRMAKVKKTEDAARPLPKETDPYEYARSKLFMFSGTPQEVTFRCKESVMDQMIDVFGTDLITEPGEGNSFRFTVAASRTGAKYLAQQYMDAIEIVAPEDLRQEFIRDLIDVCDRYIPGQE